MDAGVDAPGRGVGRRSPMTSAASARTVIIRFHQSSEQCVGDVRKVLGLAKVRQLIGVIDALDLEANPRASKVGPVTRAIQNSLETTPELFPFKTKGILLGASDYKKFDQRERYQLTFIDPGTEGILDGGHNMLAIGLAVLERACGHAGMDVPRKIKTWADFKRAWTANRDYIDAYLEDDRSAESSFDDILGVYVPVEVILPSSEDSESIGDFKSSLLDICAARNNNVQLSDSTKANQRGDFDSLKSIIKKHNSALADRIEWKTNDGGDIRVEDIISFTWIPLAMLGNLTDGNGKIITPPSPVTLYSGKPGALNKYEQLMDSDEVTIQTGKDFRRELKSPSVGSALEVAADIPALYDYIYEVFPMLYNKAGGHYNAINAVIAQNEKFAVKVTPFGHKKIETISPAGFIAPYVYGLQALLSVTTDGFGHETVSWKLDPLEWLENNLGKVVERCWRDIIPWNYDPVRYGKAQQSYEHALDAYKMVVAGI